MDKLFSRLRKEISDKDKVREELIVKSRPILKDAKQAIYAVHRGELDAAEKLLKRAEKSLSGLRELAEKQSSRSLDAALEEYAEAAAYLHYVKTGKLLDNKKLDIDAENYLLGICDLTGELSRRAVNSVVKEDFEEVRKIKGFVSEIYEEFLQFDLRNSQLRKKSDSIKWNLKKIEEILYDMKIRGKE